MRVAGKQGSQFFIQVWDGILDPKHIKAMREAIWLYLWFLNGQTDEHGTVKYAKEIPMSDIAAALGVSEKTAWRWLKKLLAAGYIADDPTYKGHRIVITKAKKRSGHKCPGLVTSDQGGRTDMTRSLVTSDQGGRTDMTPPYNVVTKQTTRASTRQQTKDSGLELTSPPNSDPQVSVEAFMGEWNAWDKRPKIKAMLGDRLEAFTLLTQEPLFRNQWRKAVRGARMDKRYCSIEWFLRDANWVKCLESYDPDGDWRNIECPIQ